jgi:hypothetical protein
LLLAVCVWPFLSELSSATVIELYDCSSVCIPVNAKQTQILLELGIRLPVPERACTVKFLNGTIGYDVRD